ncbi:MAG: hypothetical protein II299_03210 [Alistipes sp.]|nr:hypothetical protein [Alistipes sp.]
MTHTNDEFNPLSEEELRQREEDALFRRRVRDEVRRIQSGEAQEDIERDIEEEEMLEAEQTRKEAKKRLKRARLFYQLFSGSILQHSSVTKHYGHLIAIAVASLVSIMVMFAALYADMKYSRLEREVQLMRERSIRLREQLYQRTTHAAVVEELQKRGINLQEPRKRREKVED